MNPQFRSPQLLGGRATVGNEIWSQSMPDKSGTAASFTGEYISNAFKITWSAGHRI